MAGKRLTMLQIRNSLRLRWGRKLRVREVARNCGISPSTVSNCVVRAQTAGLSGPLSEELDDARLESLLYRTAVTGAKRPAPDYTYIHLELKKWAVTTDFRAHDRSGDWLQSPHGRVWKVVSAPKAMANMEPDAS